VGPFFDFDSRGNLRNFIEIYPIKKDGKVYFHDAAFQGLGTAIIKYANSSNERYYARFLNQTGKTHYLAKDPFDPSSQPAGIVCNSEGSFPTGISRA
jgi:hypothetical protein